MVEGVVEEPKVVLLKQKPRFFKFFNYEFPALLLLLLVSFPQDDSRVQILGPYRTPIGREKKMVGLEGLEGEKGGEKKKIQISLKLVKFLDLLLIFT